MRTLRLRSALAGALFVMSAAAGEPPGGIPPANPSQGGLLPATPKKPVTDAYHAVEVSDDYRWLERWDDPAVRAWSDAGTCMHARSSTRSPATPRSTGYRPVKSPGRRAAR